MMKVYALTYVYNCTYFIAVVTAETETDARQQLPDLAKARGWGDFPKPQDYIEAIEIDTVNPSGVVLLADEC